MKAARLYAAGDLRIEEIPDPGDPGPGEVRLRVERAGICGSDLHNFHTGQWISRAPSTPGHEFVARVEQIGEGVDELEAGDRVIADSRVPCGRCDSCLAGRAYLCPNMAFVGEVNDGGFAPVTIQKAGQVLRLPDQSVSPAIATLAEPLAVALHAVNRADVEQSDSVIVVGAGPIGALCALMLHHRGVDHITIADRNEDRRHLVAALAEADEASLDDKSAAPVDRAIDTTGAAAVLPQLVQCVRRGGRIAVVGLYGRAMSLDANFIVEGGLDIAGCAAFDNELVEAVALLPALAPTLTQIAADPAGLDELPNLYDHLSKGQGTLLKATIDPSLP